MPSDNRFVLVTGASGGIGRAVCVRLAQSGRALVLAARDEGRMLALCDELQSVRPGRYEAIPVDVSVAAFGERGIHINTLSLGGTLAPDYTASLQRRAEQAGVSFAQRLADETSNIPLAKYGRPEEVAMVVEQLLGALSDHMTGANLLHDGGFTRAY